MTRSRSSTLRVLYGKGCYSVLASEPHCFYFTEMGNTVRWKRGAQLPGRVESISALATASRALTNTPYWFMRSRKMASPMAR